MFLYMYVCMHVILFSSTFKSVYLKVGSIMYLSHYCPYLDDLAFSSAGSGAGVGGGGGGRRHVWHHATQGTRPAGGLKHGRAPYSLQLRPVPHGEGAQAEGRHPGASGHPPAGP